MNIGVQFAENFDGQACKMFNDEEFFMIDSPSIHLRLVHCQLVKTGTPSKAGVPYH